MIDDCRVRDAFGHAARTELGRMLEAGDRPVERVALESVVLTFSSDEAASTELLARLLESARVAAFGYGELMWVAQQAAVLVAVAPALVVGLYDAAFEHEEQSEEVTSMREGVMPMTSTRRQDFGMVRYSLGQVFGAVLAADGDAGMEALRKAAMRVAARRTNVTDGQTLSVHWPGGDLEVTRDGSGRWDGSGLEPALGTMLQAWQAALVTRCDDAACLTAWLEAMVRRSWPAVVIARTFSAARSGTEPCLALLEAIGAALTESAVLRDDDLGHVAVRALAAAFTEMDDAARNAVEDIVLGLVEGPGDDPFERESSGYLRDQFLTAVDVGLLRSPAAVKRRAALDAASMSPGGQRPLGDGWIDEARPAQAQPTNDAEERIHELVARLEPLREAQLSNAEAPVQAASLVAETREVLAALEVLGGELSERAVLHAQGHLGIVALAIGNRTDGDLTPDQRQLIRDVARTLERSPVPLGHDDERWETEQVGLSWPLPRADAALLWLQLGADGACDEELVIAVRCAAGDPAAAVRVQVAKKAWWLRERAAEVAWEVIEGMCASEPTTFVGVETLESLHGLSVLDAERALAAAAGLHVRLLDRRAPRWAIGATSTYLVWSWTHSGSKVGRREAERLIAGAGSDPDGASHVLFPWREALTAGDDNPEDTARRRRAIELWTGIAVSALTPFEQLLSTPDADDGERLKALGSLLLQLAAEIQFAAGASGLEPGENDWRPTPHQHARLWREASALLDAVCRIGIPAAADDIVKTLASFVEVDPKGVLGRLVVVLDVAERFGYQGDALAETSFNALVAALLSSQRDVVLSDEVSRAHLLAALASFARAGSASARTTLLGLDDLLR